MQGDSDNDKTRHQELPLTSLHREIPYRADTLLHEYEFEEMNFRNYKNPGRCLHALGSG